MANDPMALMKELNFRAALQQMGAPWQEAQATRGSRVAAAMRGQIPQRPMAATSVSPADPRSAMLDAVMGGQDIRFGGLNGPMPYSALRDNVARAPGGGGYRVHPMVPNFSGPMPVPSQAAPWNGPRGVPGGDPAAAAALLRQRMPSSNPDGSPMRLNFNAAGEANGFGQAPASGQAGFNFAAQRDRLNSSRRDPRDHFQLHPAGGLVDSSGNFMSGADAQRMILAENNAARGQQEAGMRASQAARSNMKRERVDAMRWNAGMAALNGNDQDFAIGGLGGRGLRGAAVGMGNEGFEGMPGGMKDRLMGLEDQRQRVEQGLGNRALDLKQLALQQEFADKAMERQGTLTPRQKAAVDIWGKGIDPEKMPPGQANKAMNDMKKWLLGDEGGAAGAAGGMPDIPMPAPGKGGLDQAGLSPEHRALAETATSRDDLWNKMVRAGVWKPNDPESLRQFKDALTQLQLDTPVGDVAMQLSPFTIGGPLMKEYNRYQRGEPVRPPLWRLLMGE